MKSPIVKLGIAAALMAVVGLGILEFIGTGSTSGVVWAEVAQKVQASRGLIYRESHPDEPDEVVYLMYYDSPTRGRIDLYKKGQLVRSVYSDLSTRDFLVIHHQDRRYYRHPMDDRDVQDHEREMHLRAWVEEVLSRPHTNLGRQTVAGVLCEGIETKCPIFGDMDAPVGNSARRVWVSVETGYPVLCEGGSLENDGKLRIEIVFDQFQWDADLGASEFEPTIPPDYEKMD